MGGQERLERQEQRIRSQSRPRNNILEPPEKRGAWRTCDVTSVCDSYEENGDAIVPLPGGRSGGSRDDELEDFMEAQGRGRSRHRSNGYDGPLDPKQNLA